MRISDNTRVEDSRLLDGEYRRKRQCKGCLAYFWTVERTTESDEVNWALLREQRNTANDKVRWLEGIVRQIFNAEDTQAEARRKYDRGIENEVTREGGDGDGS